MTSALDRPELARLWDRVAERLQRNGLAPSGVVVLDGLDRGERHALAGLLARPVLGERARIDLGLLARPVLGERARIDLGLLDTRLRAGGTVEGLVAVIEALRGPLVDRVGRRKAVAEHRAGLWATGRDALTDAGLAAASWTEAWLEDLRRSGAVIRLPPGRDRDVLTSAVRCLARLPLLGGTPEPVRRNELAWLVTGSAHGLDDSSALAAIVLRGVAQAAGTPPARTPAERRALWRRAGVLTDEVSTTVLTFGLRPSGDDATAVALRHRSDGGLEAHITFRDLRRLEDPIARETPVFVCENPSVLEAAVDAGSQQVIVCTQGNPTVVVTTLVDRLVKAGADVRYRGDFDWPGLVIANRMVSEFGCRPWRMGVGDYEEALRRAGPMVGELPSLVGEPVVALWDPELDSTMARCGLAVHEEALLELLVDDLVEEMHVVPNRADGEAERSAYGASAPRGST